MGTKGNEQEFSNLRLLIVEDNEAASWGLSIILRKKCEYIVETALTAEDALSMVESYKPDAILIDIGLPDMDGCELAKELRKYNGMENADMLAVTGYNDEITAQRIRDAGFAGCLVKPVTADQILDFLNTIRV